MTQQEVTTLGLRVAEYDEKIRAAVAPYPAGTDVPVDVQNSTLSLHLEREAAQRVYDAAKARLDQEFRATVAQTSNGPVNMLPAPGVRVDNGNHPFKVRDAYYGKMRHFPNTEQGMEDAYLSGLFVRATVAKEDGIQPIRREARQKLQERYGIDVTNPATYRGLAEANNTTGGFLVPTVFETAVIKLREDYGVFEQNAQKVPLTTDQVKWPRRNQGIDANWEGEAVSIPFDASLAFNQVSLSARTLTSLIAFSNQLSDDSIIPLADYLAGEMAYKFSYKLDAAAFIGDGTSTYGGIVGLKSIFNANIPGTSTPNPGLVTGTVTGEAADWTKITIGEIAVFMGAMRVFGSNASNWKFYCSNAFYQAVLLRLSAQGGGNTIISIQQGPNEPSTLRKTFLGYEVVITQVLPSTISGGSTDIVCYFGDMTQSSMFGERKQTSIATSTEAGNAFQNNQTYMRAIGRFDINHHDAGLTTLDPSGANIAGPIVAFKTHS